MSRLMLAIAAVIALFTLLLMDAAPAQAQSACAYTGANCITPQPLSSTSLVTNATVSVGTAAVTIDAAQTRRSYAMIMNPAAAGGSVIGCAWGSTAVLYAGGSITLYPGGSFTWDGAAVPNGALSCIASTAASPITVMLLDQ